MVRTLEVRRPDHVGTVDGACRGFGLRDAELREGRVGAGALVSGVERAVTAWAAGAPAADDITVVVVRRAS